MTQHQGDSRISQRTQVDMEKTYTNPPAICRAEKRSKTPLGGPIGVSIIGLLINLVARKHDVTFAMPVAVYDLGSTTTSSDISDYVQTDEELQDIMARIKNDSVISPHDFVSDDLPLDQVLKAIELAGIDPTRSRRDMEGELIESLDEIESAEPIAPTTTTTTTTTSPAATTTTQFPFVASDEEYDRIIGTLSKDAANSISHPLNYVANDNDLEKILKIIAAGEVDKLHERWLENRDLFADEGDCPICQEEFSPQDEQTKLSCNHLFHAECLRNWFKVKSNCPMCRRAAILYGNRE